MAQYRNNRPTLAIEVTGTRNLGRCFNATTYRITTTFKLNKERLKALRTAGFLGYGQEFYFKGVNDGSEEPAGFDTVKCLEEDGKPAINEYTKQPYNDTQAPFYVYECEDRCDSGD